MRSTNEKHQNKGLKNTTQSDHGQNTNTPTTETFRSNQLQNA